MRPCIMVFAKAPLPGRVKTRLIGHVTADQAAALHSALLLDLLATLKPLDADLELHTDVETDAWRSLEVARRLQSPGELGRKMFCALSVALARTHPVAMVLGSDTPSPPISHLETLLSSTADVTLGPSEDGGFYAIACRRVHPAMFDGVEWSRQDTLDRTVAAVSRTGLSAGLGRHWWDVDSPADLERLARLPDLGRYTREWLSLSNDSPGSRI